MSLSVTFNGCDSESIIIGCQKKTALALMKFHPNAAAIANGWEITLIFPICQSLEVSTRNTSTYTYSSGKNNSIISTHKCGKKKLGK